MGHVEKENGISSILVCLRGMPWRWVELAPSNGTLMLFFGGRVKMARYACLPEEER